MAITTPLALDKYATQLGEAARLQLGRIMTQHLHDQGFAEVEVTHTAINTAYDPRTSRQVVIVNMTLHLEQP